MEGLKGFSASGFPPFLNSLHFSPREAVENNYSHCSPLIETLLLPLDLGVEGLALNRSRVKGPTLHRNWVSLVFFFSSLTLVHLGHRFLSGRRTLRVGRPLLSASF